MTILDAYGIPFVKSNTEGERLCVSLVEKGVCFICKGSIISPIAVRCCGSVFCEVCIEAVMKSNYKICPVSKDVLSSELNLRIYD